MHCNFQNPKSYFKTICFTAANGEFFNVLKEYAATYADAVLVIANVIKTVVLKGMTAMQSVFVHFANARGKSMSAMAQVTW